MPTLDELGIRVDLQQEPWRYPGPALPFAALQVDDMLLPLCCRADPCTVRLNGGETAALDDALRRRGVAVMAERTLVLAVGSNRSASTMFSKFEPAGVSAVIPSIPAVIDGLAAGYSAHVSRAGFIAAAPFRAPGRTLAGVISALDRRQLACLDATEPNYLRTLSAARIEDEGVRRFVGGSSVDLYASRHGVIGDENRRPVPFTDQGDILAVLARAGLLPKDLVSAGTPVAVRLLRRQPALREDLRAALSGLSLDSGFAVAPTA